MTSQYEEFSPQRHRLVGRCSTSAPTRSYAHKLARLDLPTPADMRAPGAATGVYALECAMDELAVALKLDPLELRLALLFGSRPERGPALHQQEAARMLPPGRGGVRLGQAQPGAALDARRQRTGRLGHGDRHLGSAADADRGPHRADRQRPRRGLLRDLRHRHRHLHDHGAGRGRHARPAAREHHASSSATRRCRSRRSRADRGWRPRCRMRSPTRPTRSARSCCGWRRRCRTRRSPARSRTTSRSRTARSSASRTPSRAVSIADAMRHGKVDRIEQEKTNSFERRRHARAQHAFGDLRRGEGRRAARRHPRHARRQRGRGRAHPQPQDRAQPDHGRRGLGHRHGAARGDAGRSPVRPHHERQHRRVPRAGECRRARHQGDLRRRAGRASSIRSASRASARSASSASRRRSPTRSITRPASACAICRSRSTSCWRRRGYFAPA